MKVKYSIKPKLTYLIKYMIGANNIEFVWNEALDGPIENYENNNDCQITVLEKHEDKL